MAGDWLKMLGDVIGALDAGDDAKGGLSAYLEGRSTQSAEDQAGAAPYVYERWLTRPRDPKVNDV